MFLFCNIDSKTLSATEHAKTGSLLNFVNKTSTTWKTDSLQYICRVDAVRDMIIRTGYPVTIVDETSFREMANKQQYCL